MAMSRDEYLKRKREAMSRRRRDPFAGQRVREIQRQAYANGGREKQRRLHARQKEQAWFKWREQFARRSEPRIMAAELEALWLKQGGLCALTGIPLTRVNAHLDHVIPLARGGKGLGLANLRWVTKEVNLAKRALTDDEFHGLCQSVIAWLGRRLRTTISLNRRMP
jgi:5-methylcytosine-specific restriction endonuclease McrA